MRLFAKLWGIVGQFTAENYPLCLCAFVVRPKHSDFTTEAQNSMIPFFKPGGKIAPEE